MYQMLLSFTTRAAFQYGVKMADGRKTRRGGPKDEKAVLDREWQQIQNLIAKRKKMGTDGEPYAKAPKYWTLPVGGDWREIFNAPGSYWVLSRALFGWLCFAPEENV